MSVSVTRFPHRCWTQPSAWPLQSHLELAPLPAAVPCARMHARRVLGKWRLNPDTVELVVSELVTNAVRACGGPMAPDIGLWLCSDHDRVLVQVRDGSHRMPVRQDPVPEAESGRGLLLVDSLSAQWGSYRRSGGKIVWSVIAAVAG